MHVVLHNLKNFDSHLTMQELSKFNFKRNVMTSGLEKYFIDSFQFLSS